MKRQILMSLILLGSILTVNAQLYNSWQSTPLGSNPNSFQLLNERGGSVTNNGMYNKLWLLRDATGSDWYTARLHDGISVDVSFQTPAIDTRTWWERDPANNIQSWGNADQTYFTINNGLIGIGTTNPAGQLSLASSNQELNFLVNKKLTGTWPPIDEITTMTIQSSGYNTGNLAFAVGNSEIMRISLQGSVGIGTVTPDSRYKLDVEGTVRAKEIKVCLQGGCDFVFKSDYKLMDLKDLEHFVKTNQHLPEIASEKEMVESGVNMKELQMKLLQKIEELTLYTIEQNKKMEEQNIEVQALKNEIKEMKAGSVNSLHE